MDWQRNPKFLHARQHQLSYPCSFKPLSFILFMYNIYIYIYLFICLFATRSLYIYFYLIYHRYQMDQRSKDISQHHCGLHRSMCLASSFYLLFTYLSSPFSTTISSPPLPFFVQIWNERAYTDSYIIDLRNNLNSNGLQHVQVVAHDRNFGKFTLSPTPPPFFFLHAPLIYYLSSFYRYSARYRIKQSTIGSRRSCWRALPWHSKYALSFDTSVVLVSSLPSFFFSFLLF